MYARGHTLFGQYLSDTHSHAHTSSKSLPHRRLLICACGALCLLKTRIRTGPSSQPSVSVSVGGRGPVSGSVSLFEMSSAA